MEFSNHYHNGVMAKGSSDPLFVDGPREFSSSPLWCGGMISIISTSQPSISYTTKTQAHHHHIESIPALGRVPISSQWFSDINADYASFSSHLDTKDLFEILHLTDHSSTNALGHLGIVTNPLATISAVISHPTGTSISFNKEESECHSVWYDVLLNTMCISGYYDRVQLYPISGHILFDTLSEELLNSNILHMTGKDDSGPFKSEDASRDESAQKSRNGGVVALATTPENDWLCL